VFGYTAGYTKVEEAEAEAGIPSRNDGFIVADEAR
jgi:hypothetical protein